MSEVAVAVWMPPVHWPVPGDIVLWRHRQEDMEWWVPVIVLGIVGGKYKSPSSPFGNTFNAQRWGMKPGFGGVSAHLADYGKDWIWPRGVPTHARNPESMKDD